MIRRVERGRLAYYGMKADSCFWDRVWKPYISAEQYSASERGNLDWFEEVFVRYLPRNGRILEAGCGPAHYVIALRARGYPVEGIDWGEETIKAVKALFPDLPVRVGDVARLPVPDCSYDAYIALGVFEHRREGPEAFLAEAQRVLKPGGVALISVPHFHGLRRLKARLGFYRGEPQGLAFYQYAFTVSEFTQLLEAAGFTVIDGLAYDSYKGIVDEMALLRKLVARRVGGLDLGAIVQRLLRRIPPVEKYLGHMMLFVCRSTGKTK